ncbi:MAG: SDR family oxidoreductase [Candidatus Lambdaproteobacteria bacterium]|nr:SDR family oxidoreductase [Candidatus Lambdaproteobacteria bacterium]
MPELAGKVALVAGATRGAGRGIACMLGAAGATVYCTGRSSRAGGATPGRPETIEETAALVASHGGQGIALRVDHTVEAEVQGLFAQVAREQGRLDLLVNDIWGGDPLTEWGKPFWELDVAQGLLMQQRAVHTHIMTGRHGVPLLLRGGRGLVVEITDGDSLVYRDNLFYDLAKISVIRLAHAMAHELRPRGVTALALTPGYLRSEAVLAHWGVTEADWRDGVARDPHFIASETPYFVGRAVAALAADPQVARKAGGLYSSWALAEEYGFDDVDGRRPHWGRYFAQHLAGLSQDGRPRDAAAPPPWLLAPPVVD